MKTPIFYILSVLFLVSSVSNASSFLGKAPESGIIISVNPEKIPSKSGESVLISGTIKYVKRSQANKGKEDKEDKSGGSDTKHGLLEEFKAQGIDIVGTFPSSAIDISSELTLSSVSNNEIRFSYQSKSIVADDLNQFSLKVYNNHTNKSALKKLSIIQAKLEKRLQLLAKLKKKFESGKATQDAIAAIEKEIAKLSVITSKIANKLNANENLIAENTYALQVDNLTSNYSKLSTVMNNFRFMVNSDIGSAIQGMKINLKSQIVSLSQAHESSDDPVDDNDGYLAEYYFNDQKLYSQKIIEPRKNVDVVFDYPTEKLNPMNANIFSMALYRLEDGGKGRRIGYLNYKVPVIADSVKPIWLSDLVPNHQDRYTQQLRSINLKAQDSFGRVDPATFKLLLSSQSTTKDLSGSIASTKFDDGAMYEFTGDLNPLDEGEYTLTAKISDLATNAAEDFNVVFRIDRTAPVISTTLATNTLTNKTSIEVPITASDLSPTATDVYVNNELAMTSGLKDFSANVNLNIEGNNTIRIESKDAAGNMAVAQEVLVVRDTTPPILTITLPKENDYVNGIQFNIQGQSNESIQLAKVNNQSLTISADTTIAGTFTSLREGPLMLNFEATDLAGNTAYKLINVNVVLKALNPELLSIVADPKTNTLIVKGAAGATRPGVKVKASANIFNSGEALGNSDGAFAIVLEPFSEVEISAYDPIIDKTEKVTLKFGVSDGTLLAGTVRDINGQPLLGVKVSLVNTNISVTTDENGIFRFTQAMTGGKLIYGDQNLIIDGTTIIQATGEDRRKFSIVQLPITISLNQTNVLQRSIYLAPIILDGSETPISVNNGGVVTSPHAPGVSLNIPADSVMFPSGAVSAPISMQEIPADRSTILPIEAAMPKSVVALEPSGATFSKPVELTLPNKNDFSPSAELVILLMNSKTGKWEVGGAAVVSNDGGSIVTKPGQGIRHFSLAYAAPLGPTVRPIGSKDKPGASTFDGAVITKVTIPTFKSLGKDSGAGLIYKSSWAKPTALVTNLFDMSTRKVEISVSSTAGSLVEKVKVNLPYCSLKAGIFDNPKPEDIKCVDNIQEFLYDIQYKISYKNTYSVMKPDKIEATFQTANLKSPVMTFTGMPDMAAISYATELKSSDSEEYFSSGIYPYTAHYDLHFKEITIGTRVIEQKVNLGEPQISEEAFSSDEIQRVFPQDLSEPLYVQNYTKSEAGRGWRVGGIQKIVNPSGDRVMIEEENGEIATYSLANTISTVADLNGKADLSKGVGLNKWPLVQYMDTSSNQYKQLDLTTNTASIMASPYAVTGTVAGFDFYNYTQTVVRPNWECLHHDRLRRCDRWGYKYYYDYYAKSSCSKNAYSYSITSKPSHFLMAQNGDVYGLDYGRSSVFVVRDGTSSMVGGKLTATQTFINNYQAQKTETNQQILNYCNSVDGMNCNQTLSYYNGNVDGTTACGPGVFSSGYVPDTSDLNNPMGMTAGLKPNTLVIADSGHHQVKILDLSTGQSQVIAGTGKVADSGEGIQATQADIFYPRGLVYDKYGNLYISSKAGLIRKIDTLGNIYTIAGDPTNGQILDDGDARQMKLVEPYGMVIDHSRNFLYVAETGANRVLRIDLSNGQAKTVAGNRTAGFSGDGKSALEASLNSPTHLGLDSNGNLLIADSGNQRIRRVIFQNASTGHLAFKPTAEDNSGLYRNADGTWSRVYRNGTVVYFDSLGRETRTVDRVGRITEMQYNSQGKLTQIKDPVGQIISYSYVGNRLSQITDPVGRVTSFIYTSNGLLTKVNYPDGTETNYDYTSDGLLVAEYNQRNAKTQYMYNAHNRLEKVIKPDDSEMSLQDAGSQSAVPGELKNISETKNIITDSNGNKTKIEKDFMGYIHEVTDAEGKITKLKRDLKGQTIEIQRPDGTILQNTYDQVTGDLLKITDSSSGESVESNYDQYGNVVKKTDSKGHVYTNVYSPTTGLLMKSVAPGNREAVYEYNQLGLVINKKISTNGRTPLITTYEYNGQGLISKIISPDGKSTTFKYDTIGNVVEISKMKDNFTSLVTKYFYNTANRLVKVITPNEEITEYSYLTTGELSQIKDPKDKITSFEYDIMGRVTKKTNPLGFVHEMKYDPNGNLAEELDPNGNVKKYLYSASNKIRQTILPDDLITYAYNQSGEILSVENKNSKVVYTRDIKERVTSAQVVGLSTMVNYPLVSMGYAYDSNGNLTSLNSIIGSQIFDYDELDRVSQLQTSGGSVFNFSYDDYSRIRRINRPGSQTDFSYTGGGSLEQIVHSSNQITKSFVQYGYDQSNYPIQKRSPSGILDYSYDLNGQLTGVNSSEVSKNESFSYDFLGNRLTDQNGNYIYDQTSQQLKEDYQYLYTYDNNGNLISKIAKNQAKDSFSYIYSSSNQLTAIRSFERLGDPVKKEVTYHYDVLGRRIQKEVIDTIDSSKSYTRKYVYNGENIHAEFDGSNNVLARYAYSPLSPDDMLEVEISLFGVQSGLAQTAGKFQYLKDHLGSITDITDVNGNIVQRYEYSAYGKILSIKDQNGTDITTSPIVNSSFTYTGREYDSESGMFYYRARYYDANIGRFLQQDPNPGILSLPITAVNKYVYASNSPTVFRDPTGRDFFSDAFRFMGDVILTAIAITVTVLDVALGTVGAIFGFREYPKIHFESDGWTVENSLFADWGGSTSWGPMILLASKYEYGGEVWKHEYGHRLQYQDWGGWDYMGFMVERFSQQLSPPNYTPEREMDADKRASDHFGTPICDYPDLNNHPVPECRY